MLQNIDPFDHLDKVHDFCHDNEWTQNNLIRWHNDFERESIFTKQVYKDYWEIVNEFDNDRNLWSPEFKPNEINLKFEKIRFITFAVYQSEKERKIKYFPHYLNSSESIKKIVRIHERMHSFHHYNSITGHWNNFYQTSPVYLEFLAQLFTFISVKYTHLEDEMIQLTEKQPYIYRTFLPFIKNRRYGHDQLKEKAIEYLIEIRKTGMISDLPFLNQIARQYPKPGSLIS
jgi:hypothetical protein